MHVASEQRGQAPDDGHAGRLHGLRPAVPRRPLDDGPALRASAASCSRSSSSTARTGRRRPTTSGDGEAMLEASREQGLEGVVAKRLDSRYEPGAAAARWLKVKNQRRQEFVIGGWLPGEGGRSGRIGSLAVGYYDASEEASAGRASAARVRGQRRHRVQGADLDAARRAARAAARETSPFDGRQPPKGDRFVGAASWWPRSSSANGPARRPLRAPVVQGPPGRQGSARCRAGGCEAECLSAAISRQRQAFGPARR